MTRRYVDIPRAELIREARRWLAAHRAWGEPVTPWAHGAKERCLLLAATYRRALARQAGLSPAPMVYR